MRLMPRLFTLVAALLVLSVHAGAQTREGLMGDLVKDVGDVESKLMQLAKAMPESAWTWRP